MKQDVYKKVTDTLLAALEAGTRPWMQPWHAAHAAGPVSRPLRHNGTPYQGCLLYTSPSPRDGLLSRMPSSA